MLLDLTQQELQESMKFTGLQAKRLLRELNDFKNKRTLPMSPATPTRREKISGRLIKMSSAMASTVVGAVPSKVNILKSKKGFVTGLWEGFFEYDGGLRDKTSMDVTMIAGLVTGYGTDQVGDFLVQGTYDDERLTCAWDKAYVGQHTVYYTGKLEGGKTIKGKWEIPDDNSGRFEMTMTKAK